jgi:hypothetical protein
MLLSSAILGRLWAESNEMSLGNIQFFLYGSHAKGKFLKRLKCAEHSLDPFGWLTRQVRSVLDFGFIFYFPPLRLCHA